MSDFNNLIDYIKNNNFEFFKKYYKPQYLNQVDLSNKSLLILSVVNANIKVFNFLLKQENIDLYLSDLNNRNVFMYSLDMKTSYFANRLKFFDFNIYQTDAMDFDNLTLAILNDKKTIFEYLINKHGIEKDEDYCLRLMKEAFSSERYNFVKVLMDQGINPHQKRGNINGSYFTIKSLYNMPFKYFKYFLTKYNFDFSQSDLLSFCYIDDKKRKFLLDKGFFKKDSQAFELSFLYFHNYTRHMSTLNDLKKYNFDANQIKINKSEYDLGDFYSWWYIFYIKKDKIKLFNKIVKKFKIDLNKTNSLGLSYIGFLIRNDTQKHQFKETFEVLKDRINITKNDLDLKIRISSNTQYDNESLEKLKYVEKYFSLKNLELI